MTTDLIPREERGRFLITPEVLMSAGYEDMERAQSILLEEARARGLELSTEDDQPGGIWVRWRPAVRHAEEGSPQ